MGAVIMKITSSSRITSIRLTTLISAFSASSRRRWRATLEAALAHEQRDHGGAESLEQIVEPVEPIRENVVAEGGGNGDGQRSRRRDQRLGDARRHRRQVPRPCRRD